MTQISPIHIVGGGLAGSEAAWQIAQAGVPVVIHEMRPVRGTDAHKTQDLAELVCSNSFRSDDAETNAVGLLHAENAPHGLADHGDGRRQPGACRWRAGRRPRRLFGGSDGGTGGSSAGHDRAGRGGGPAARRMGQGDHRDRAADLARSGGGDPQAIRRDLARLLRRHRADRPFRIRRHGDRLVPVALRQGRSRRHRRRLHQLPDGQGAV